MLTLAAVFTAGCVAREHASGDPPPNDRASSTQGTQRTSDALARAPEHEITATLREDGSCSATVDGRELFRNDDYPRVSELHDAVAGMAPEGYHVEQIWCAPGKLAVDGAVDPGSRAVSIALLVRDGSALPLGDFAIRPLVAGDAADPHAASVAVFGTTASEGPGLRYLEGEAGRISLTRVASRRVAATLSARASEATSM